MKMDPEFYEFARAFPDAYPLLFLGRRPRGPYRVTSPALKSSERRIDLVLEPRDPADPWWVVECQARRDARAERGLYRKAVLFADERNIWGRVRSAIVYTTAVVARASLPPVLAPGPGGGSLEPVRVILGEMDPEDLMALGPELFTLVPLARLDERTLAERIPIWLRAVRRGMRKDPRRLADMTDRFVRLCGDRFPRDIMHSIQNRLGGKMLPIKKGSLHWELRELAKKQAIEKGRREGIEQGLRDSIRDVLAARLGRVPDRVVRLLGRTHGVRRLRRALRQAMEAPDMKTFVESLETD